MRNPVEFCHLLEGTRGQDKLPDETQVLPVQSRQPFWQSLQGHRTKTLEESQGKKMTKIAVVGAGYVGMSMATLLAQGNEVQIEYSTSLMKRAMDDMESQAMALIEMMGSVPSQYSFDVRA